MDEWNKVIIDMVNADIIHKFTHTHGVGLNVADHESTWASLGSTHMASNPRHGSQPTPNSDDYPPIVDGR